MRLKLFENFDKVFTKDDVKEILQDIIDDYDCEVVFTEGSDERLFDRPTNWILNRYKTMPYDTQTSDYLRIDFIFNDDLDGSNSLDIFRSEIVERLIDYDFSTTYIKKTYDVDQYGSSTDVFGKLANKISSYIIIKL